MATSPPNPPQNRWNHRPGGKPPRRPRLVPSPPVVDVPPTSPVSPTPVPSVDAGPRPLSERQREFQAESLSQNRPARGPRAAETVESSDPVIIAPVPEHARRGGTTDSRQKQARRSVTGVRDAETTRIRRLRAAQKAAKKATRPNRRRVNYPRLLLGWASAALVLETAAALFWSPRLWVKTVDVEGCKSIAPQRILTRLHIGPRENLVRLPVGKLRLAAEAEPTVEWAELKRTVWPQVGVHIFVRERTPWASVEVGGASYTIDRNLVPFRKSQTPEGKLPRLVLSGASGETVSNIAPVLGKPMTAPGLADVSRCLAWSASQPTFPLESVEIDPQGKLCLNKVGGLPVRLGSGVDLDKKLKTLGLLLATRPELRASDGIAEINLFAFDAPAVLWRAAASTSATIPTVLPSSFSPAAVSGGEIVP